MKQFFNARNLLVVAMLTLAGILLLVISNRYTRIQPAAVVSQSEDADLSLENIDYTETREGKAVWRLKAADANHDLERQVTRLSNVDLTFYGDGEAGDMQLTADRGLWNAEAGVLEVSGNVVSISENGYRFTSERVHYKEANRLLWTDEPVRLMSDQLEIKGKGMRLFVDSRKLKLLADVWSRWQSLPQAEGRG